MGVLSREEIDRTFSLDEQLRHVDTLFDRVFGDAGAVSVAVDDAAVATIQ